MKKDKEKFLKVSNSFIKEFCKANTSKLGQLIVLIELNTSFYTELFSTSLCMLADYLGWSKRTETYATIKVLLYELSEYDIIDLLDPIPPKPYTHFRINLRQDYFSESQDYTKLTLNEYNSLINLSNSSNKRNKVDNCFSLYLYLKSYGKISCPTLDRIKDDTKYTSRMIHSIVDSLTAAGLLYSDIYHVTIGTPTIRRLFYSTESVTDQLVLSLSDYFASRGYLRVVNPRTKQVIWNINNHQKEIKGE